MNNFAFDPYGGDQAAPVVEKRFLTFLLDYDAAAEGGEAAWPPSGGGSSSASFAPPSRYEYVNAAHGMRQHDMSTLYVNFAHLRAHDDTLASTVAAEFYRCVSALKWAGRREERLAGAHWRATEAQSLILCAFCAALRVHETRRDAM